jgi:4-hydroxythreonine-4-phosphate dehydrogenase
MSRKARGQARKPLCITLGDPVGIGPEVLVKALAESGVDEWNENFLIVGSEEPLHQAARVVGVSFEFDKVTLPLPEKTPHIALLEPPDIESGTKLVPGRPGAESGWLSFKYLELGTKLALEGVIQALVTLPVSKSLIARRMPGFRGHTEYLQETANARDVRMMLGTDELRITLVTTHLPLAEVARNLLPDDVAVTIQVTSDALKPLLGRPPLIVVCALNPHAGDSGLLGDEESEVITPGVITASNSGCRCAGPYPADVALAMAAKGDYDAAVAMYHDQALIALKLVSPNRGSNMTLGLPFVRTSPLHGTAFDIAGRGMADENSCVDALKAAVDMAGG